MHIRNPVEWVLERFQANPGIGTANPREYWPAEKLHSRPEVNEIDGGDLGEALTRGWHDFAAARTDVVMFFLIYPVLVVFIAAADKWGEILPLLFPTASGFALVGPFFATGLYEMSRQRELTGKTRWADSFAVLTSPAIGSIAFMGVLLIMLFLAWLVVATGIYDLTMGPDAPASAFGFLIAVVTTPAGWAMATLGLLAGGVFAVLVLTISVVTFPLLLDRPVTLKIAIQTSVAAARLNPGPMARWGALVAGGLVLGCLPCFIGLIVVLPVLGHATWHLYRKLVTN